MEEMERILTERFSFHRTSLVARQDHHHHNTHITYVRTHIHDLTKSNELRTKCRSVKSKWLD